MKSLQIFKKIVSFSKPKFLLGCFISTSMFYSLYPHTNMVSPPGKTEYFPKFPEHKLKQFLAKHLNVTCLNSNISIEYLLSHLRDKNLDCFNFRYYANRIICILLETAVVVQELKEVRKESPLGYYDALETHAPLKNFCAVTILRAGNSFLEELLHLFPGIPVGQVLVQRNEESENKEPIFYYSKLPPKIQTMKVLLCDPMVGTGGSLCMTLKHLKEKGVIEDNITIVAMIGCCEGIAKVYREYPKVKMVIGFIDAEDLVKSSKYIAPGLGDFGDRYFGTNH